MTNLAENITKVVLDVLKRGGDNYNIYVAVKAALAITPAVGGEDQFHPGKCLPDCMMPDGGECCPGYAALYDAYWRLVGRRDCRPEEGSLTYYVEGKNAEYFEKLDNVAFAWQITRASQDIVDNDFGPIEEWMPITAMLGSAASRIRALAAPPASPLRGRDSVIEECAKIAECWYFGSQAATHIRELSASPPEQPAEWECQGRKQSLPEPGECNWPDCGCDPYATKVIEALDEQEALKSDRPSHSAMHDLIRAIIEDDVSYDAAKNTWDTAKAATAIIAAFDASAPNEPSPQKK